MKTFKKNPFEYNFTVALEIEKLAQYWFKRLDMECPEQNVANRESIVKWLVETDLHQFETLNSKELDITKEAMEYRYKILLQRYLGVSRERAYRNLITRLGSLVTSRHKVQTWIPLSRDTHKLKPPADRQRIILDVLEKVIQELLETDNYIQQQIICISEFTTDSHLRNALLFASLEEYSLRSVSNQPLLVYRFINYLRCHSLHLNSKSLRDRSCARGVNCFGHQ